MFGKKNQVCFGDSLKVKTWWVAAAKLVLRESYCNV